MRINCHTHIFNFRSVFTEKTLQILVNRLTREKWPAFLVNAISVVLKRLVKGEYLDEEELLGLLVKQISVSKEFKSYLKKLNGEIPANLGIVLDGNVDGLAVGALREILQKIGDVITENDDADHQTLTDLIAFLANGIRPTIGEIADQLIGLSGDDTAVVALMMDITSGGKEGEALFLRQLEDTSRAALAYPGRLLPFVAVNTLRKSHFERMEMALTQRGFVGVKLYPSLGYDLRSQEMDRVFAYCAANQVPLLTHCNRGGFFATVEDIQKSNPSIWGSILTKYPDLRICFGHFGGDEFLARPAVPPSSWTATILDLMRAFTGVYADIAYHTDPMMGGKAERNYFANLGKILDDPVLKTRVLFGSDFFLVRQRIREDNHWRYFQSKFTVTQLRLIAESNPLTFLGLPGVGSAGLTRNIQRHLDWLYTRRNDVSTEPAAWVLRALKQNYGDVVFTVNALSWRWSPNNEAHFRCWRFFGNNQMYPHHQKVGFADAGGLLVRQMRYWNKEHEAPEIFQRKCAAVAEHMNAFFLNANAKHENAHSRKTVERGFAKLLSDGDTRLADLAVATDRMFRFQTEVV
jgi:predicted TIM-barrel fold metal-dependent hydrolase